MVRNISAKDEETVKAALKAAVETAKKCIQCFALKWYQLDDSALPEPVYVLKNLSHIKDRLYWDVALPVLLKALYGVAFEEWGVQERRRRVLW